MFLLLIENVLINFEEFEELLKNDNKVKVVGMYFYLCYY